MTVSFDRLYQQPVTRWNLMSFKRFLEGILWFDVILSVSVDVRPDPCLCLSHAPHIMMSKRHWNNISFRTQSDIAQKAKVCVTVSHQRRLHSYPKHMCQTHSYASTPLLPCLFLSCISITCTERKCLLSLSGCLWWHFKTLINN